MKCSLRASHNTNNKITCSPNLRFSLKLIVVCGSSRVRLTIFDTICKWDAVTLLRVINRVIKTKSLSFQSSPNKAGCFVGDFPVAARWGVGTSLDAHWFQPKERHFGRMLRELQLQAATRSSGPRVCAVERNGLELQRTHSQPRKDHWNERSLPGDSSRDLVISWRSLGHWKGHFTIPEKVNLNHLVTLVFLLKSVIPKSFKVNLLGCVSLYVSWWRINRYLQI